MITAKPVVVDSDDSDVPQTQPQAGPGSKTTAHRTDAHHPTAGPSTQRLRVPPLTRNTHYSAPGTEAHRATPGTIHLPPSTPQDTTGALKRKRDVPLAAAATSGAQHDSRYSSPGSRPVVLIGKVGSHTKLDAQDTAFAHRPPSTPTPPARAKGSSIPKVRANLASRLASPIKQVQPQVPPNIGEPKPKRRIQMRRVVGKTKPPVQIESSPPPEAKSSAVIHQEKADKDMEVEVAVGNDTEIPARPLIPEYADDHWMDNEPVLDVDGFPPSPIFKRPKKGLEKADIPADSVSQATTVEAALAIDRPTTPIPPDVEVTSESEQDHPEANGLRRTSRTRKSVHGGSVGMGLIISGRTRRKTLVLGPPDTSIFSGMSVLALKTLTSNNTVRNQKQVAELETEVIVKEGKRPESPTTKVRTTLEKQKEERAKEREERAARRARRHAVSGGEEGASDGLGEDSIMTEQDTMDGVDGTPTKHIRAPGDESDYETPEKSERPAKRSRFEDGAEDVADKRVKWDRGLQTTVTFDDTPPKPRKPPKGEALNRKGCLAPTAKV